MKLILGGPGAGKTHRLLSVLDEAFSRGVAPDRVAFVSFTRKAVDEAAGRSTKQFKIPRDDLPYFRTLHSLAFRELGLSRTDVLSKQHLQEFAEAVGIEIRGGVDWEDDATNAPIGDRMLFLEGYARSTRQSLKDVWHEFGEDIDWYQLKYFVDSLAAFKRERSLIDFTDMLEMFLTDCSPIPVDIAIVDEAQDLNALQWAVVERAFGAAAEIYVAGDDDQSIYRWSGADVERFLSLPATGREILPRSHRLPPEIFSFAAGIIGRVGRRYEKKWGPRPGSGSIDYHRDVDHINMEDGSWLLMARNAHFLNRYKNIVRENGFAYTTRQGSSIDPDDTKAIVAYEHKLRRGETVSATEARVVLSRLNLDTKTIEDDRRYSVDDLGIDVKPIWHDAMTGITLSRREYYLSILRRGDKLPTPPRIHLDTIHASKGGEADNVVVLTDITRRSYDSLMSNPDDEHRVFYVGFTRARSALHIVLPTTIRAYAV